MKGLVASIALVATVLFSAVPSRSGAATCTLDCKVNMPTQYQVFRAGQTVYFQASKGDSESCHTTYVYCDFGDGSTAKDGSSNNWDHVYKDPGWYDWNVRVYENITGGVQCLKAGRVLIVPADCALTCSGQATVVNQATREVRFTATGTLGNCAPAAGAHYRWDFGDGVSSDATEDTTVSHTYAADGSYYWHLYAGVGPKEYASYVTCEATGTVKVGCAGVAVQGKLCFEADQATHNGKVHTLTGNVSVKNALHFAGPVTLTDGGPDNPWELQTPNDIYIRLENGPQTLLKGPCNLSVYGNSGRLVPLVSEDTRYEFRFDRLSLYAMGSEIKLYDGWLEATPRFYVGILNNWVSARLSAVVSLHSLGQKHWDSTEVVNGEPTSYYRLAAMDLAYDQAQDKLTGTAKVQFPKLGQWTVDTDVLLTGGCIDELRFKGKPTVNFLFNMGNELEARNLEGALRSLCSVGDFRISMKADLGPADPFRGCFGIAGADMLYFPNLAVFEVKAGTLELPGSQWSIVPPGEVQLLPAPSGGWLSVMYGKASGEIPGYLKGELTRWAAMHVHPSKLWFAARFTGTFSIPAFVCAVGDADCRAKKALLLYELGSGLPHQFSVTDWKALSIMSRDNQSYAFREKLDLWPHRITIRLSISQGGPALFIGPELNSLAVPPAASALTLGTGVERSVSIASAAEAVTFAVAGTGALPSIRLRTPQGATITPSNVGSFPTVAYFADAEDNVALFTVRTPTLGAWILGEDNLPESSVTFLALAPQPPPKVAVTLSHQGGADYAVTATVAPASAETTVGIFYSRAADGIPEGVIAEDQPASTGAVSATWDTLNLATGTYYVFASADDGKNTPVTGFCANPVVVDTGALQPPTGLGGTRSGATVTLSWTASPSQGVAGYRILYTDAPEIPGYLFTAIAPASSGTTIQGLDPTKSYRFCAQAYDAGGQYSLESDPLTFAGRRLRRRLQSEIGAR